MIKKCQVTNVKNKFHTIFFNQYCQKQGFYFDQNKIQSLASTFQASTQKYVEQEIKIGEASLMNFLPTIIYSNSSQQLMFDISKLYYKEGFCCTTYDYLF